MVSPYVLKGYPSRWFRIQSQIDVHIFQVPETNTNFTPSRVDVDALVSIPSHCSYGLYIGIYVLSESFLSYFDPILILFWCCDHISDPILILFWCCHSILMLWSYFDPILMLWSSFDPPSLLWTYLIFRSFSDHFRSFSDNFILILFLILRS